MTITGESEKSSVISHSGADACEVSRARKSSYLGDFIYSGELVSAAHSGGERRSLAQEKKRSLKLTDEQVANLREAASHANALGKPLNRFITLDWQLGGVKDHAAATASFLKAVSDFLAYHGYSLAYIWTAENGQTYGVHVHILLHADRSMARLLSNKHRAWLKAAGATWCKGLIKTKPVGHRTSAYIGCGRGDYTSNFDLHAERVLAYVLKCCSFEAARANGSHFRATSSPVTARRCGLSHNIGPTARARHESEHGSPQ